MRKTRFVSRSPQERETAKRESTHKKEETPKKHTCNCHRGIQEISSGIVNRVGLYTQNVCHQPRWNRPNSPCCQELLRARPSECPKGVYRVHFRARRDHFKWVEGPLPASQGQNLASAGPYSPNNGSLQMRAIKSRRTTSEQTCKISQSRPVSGLGGEPFSVRKSLNPLICSERD